MPNAICSQLQSREVHLLTLLVKMVIFFFSSVLLYNFILLSLIFILLGFL